MPAASSSMQRIRNPSNRRRDNGQNLFDVCFPDSNLRLGYLDYDKRDNDDTSSITSHSTTSTVDDNPGTGRLVDKYLYQKGGKKVERLIFWIRIKLPNAHPALLLRGFRGAFVSFRHPTSSLSDTMCIFTLTPGLISRLQNLVRQAQSTSIGRSTLALSALIGQAVRLDMFADFFIGVSKVEPIFHLESLAMTLDNSRPEKRFTLLLVTLAKATVISQDPRQPSAEDAKDVRQRLLILLEYRQDSLETISDACFIYADAISCMQLGGADGVVSLHIVETIYFLTILFIRSIYDLHSQVYSFELRVKQHINVVLSTLTTWLDATLSRCIYTCSNLGTANTSLLEIGCSFNSLFAVFFTINPVAKRSFPMVCSSIRRILINPFSIPRRVRNTIDKWMENWWPIEALLRRYGKRSVRLLASLDEVHWEVWDSTLRCRRSMTEVEEIKEHPSEGWKVKAERTLYRARQVQVNEDKLTEEFRSARSEFCQGFRLTVDQQLVGWNDYERYCHCRRTWAPYFCSNLDWDWDVAGSLKHLYKLDKASQPATAHRPSTGITTVSANSTTWSIPAWEPQRELPEEVRIAYVTETGEIRYMTFSRDVKSTEVSTGVRTSVSDHDDNPDEQGFSDSRKEGLRISRDALPKEMGGVDSEENVATTAMETSSDSELSLDFQERDFESWSAQDIGGLPVIPCANEALKSEAFIEELASETEGEGAIFRMSAKSTQVPPKGSDPTNSFAQHTSFVTEAPQNQAFIEELDDEKDADEDITTSEISIESAQEVPSNEIDSASAFTGQTRIAFGMKWFQIVGVVCASILLERLTIAMLGHIFGMGRNKV